ncbi:MAG: NCS2 family permease [Bacteroidaceae bacterium]|nr:NCS2 family permease [Bacteroidaceae bacterium]MBR5963304.1 NCS2 family permease [Bacteroidaceae bacterium]
MTALQKLFGFDPEKHSVRTEILAGITTFLTMAYILAVNPSIFKSLETMPNDAVFTATALAAIIGTLVMAIYAKKPFGLAPGMGLNAFFVYTVCLGMGYSWQFALTAILIEGVIFIILSATKVREAIVNAIPTTLKKAIGAGIGLFIAFIGLQNAGFVVDGACLVDLAAFKTPAVILGLICFFLTAILVVLKVRGAILIGIIVSTLIGIPMGVTHLNGVVGSVPSVAPLFCKFEWSQILSLDMLVVVLTFLFIDMFDTIGTVVGVSEKSGMIDEKGHVDGISKVLMADAVATTAGACLGSSTTTTYVESASGVSEGGRTGLTAFTIAACFALSLLFSPLFLAIPSAATGPVLIIVGVMMMAPIRDIDWSDYSEAIPAFITATMMPFTYSIAHGIMLGMISYVLINAISGIFHKENFKKISVVMWILAILFILRYIFI